MNFLGTPLVVLMYTTSNIKSFSKLTLNFIAQQTFHTWAEVMSL